MSKQTNKQTERARRADRQRARQAYAIEDTWARVPGTQYGEFDEEGIRRAVEWLPTDLPAQTSDNAASPGGLQG